MVYEPREDSYLLLKHVKDYAKGRVLDMGCGSGILTWEATPLSEEVIGADIDPAAIKFCNRRYGEPHLHFVLSDLFHNIYGEFDLIMFNPPYLPDDPEVKDNALDGGPEGYEIIEQFLNEAKSHLKKDGVILLVFSSLSKKEVIEKIIEKDYKYAMIDSQKLDFEMLYVYRIQHK